jgi:hypothetical protein
MSDVRNPLAYAVAGHMNQCRLRTSREIRLYLIHICKILCSYLYIIHVCKILCSSCYNIFCSFFGVVSNVEHRLYFVHIPIFPTATATISSAATKFSAAAATATATAAAAAAAAAISSAAATAATNILYSYIEVMSVIFETTKMRHSNTYGECRIKV